MVVLPRHTSASGLSDASANRETCTNTTQRSLVFLLLALVICPAAAIEDIIPTASHSRHLAGLGSQAQVGTRQKDIVFALDDGGNKPMDMIAAVNQTGPQFDWLAVGDHDTCFNVPKLRKFVADLDPSVPMFIGNCDPVWSRYEQHLSRANRVQQLSARRGKGTQRSHRPLEFRDSVCCVSPAVGSKVCRPAESSADRGASHDGLRHDDRWPHGGSGYLLSRALLDLVSPAQWRSCQTNYTHWGGNVQVGKCITHWTGIAMTQYPNQELSGHTEERWGRCTQADASTPQEKKMLHSEESSTEQTEEDSEGEPEGEEPEEDTEEDAEEDAEVGTTRKGGKAAQPMNVTAVRASVLRAGCPGSLVSVSAQGEVKFDGSVLAHTQKRLRDAKVKSSPYQHVYIQSYFLPAFYECILAHLVKQRGVAGLKKIGGGNGQRFTVPMNRLGSPGPREQQAQDLGLSRPFWAAFGRTFGSHSMAVLWMSKFSRTVGPRLSKASIPYPWRGKNSRAKFSVDMDISRDVVGYTINPHTDTNAKLVTTLYYLPSDSKLAAAGTQVLKNKGRMESRHGSGTVPWNHGGGFSVALQAKFVPNTVMAFAPCWSAWHAVKKLDGKNFKGATRDTIQGFVRSNVRRMNKQQCY